MIFTFGSRASIRMGPQLKSRKMARNIKSIGIYGSRIKIITEQGPRPLSDTVGRVIVCGLTSLMSVPKDSGDHSINMILLRRQISCLTSGLI